MVVVVVGLRLKVAAMGLGVPPTGHHCSTTFFGSQWSRCALAGPVY